MALGAKPRDIRNAILGRAATVVAVGSTVGPVTAAAASPLTARTLVAARDLDAVVFAGVTALVFGVTASAGYLAARRAARVEPVHALRNQITGDGTRVETRAWLVPYMLPHARCVTTFRMGCR